MQHIFRYLVALACLLPATLFAADEWTNYNAETAEGMPGNEIQFIAPAKDGGIWLGTLNGAAHFKDGTFNPVLNEKGKIYKTNAWCILESDDLGTWIGHNKGVLKLNDDGSTVNHLEGFSIAPIIQAKPGLLWAIGKDRRSESNQLFQYDGKAWTPIEAAEKLTVVDIFQSEDKTIWLSLDGNGVLEVDPEKGLAEAVPHLEGLNVTTMAEDSRNQMWAGLWGRGVATYNGTTWDRHLKGEKESAILTIAQSFKQGVWVATSAAGLFQLPMSKTEWINHLGDEGAINTLATSRDDRVWVSSQMVGGLRYWDGTAWKVSLDSPLPIRTFLHAPDGTLYAGGVLDGLHVSK